VSGKLLSFDPQNLVIQTERGDDLQPHRGAGGQLNDLPGGVVVKPTSSGARGQRGRRSAQVSYLTGGINWHAGTWRW
jgi:hypothetical protein